MERIAALILCGLLCVDGARAESVSDLVDQAQAQAAAQHLRSPPGDNAQETIDKLWGRLKEATPAELKELSGIVIKLEASRPALSAISPDEAPTSVTPATQQLGSRSVLSDQTLPPAPSAPQPQMPAAQPQMPAAQPQMPAAQPQMPAAQPQTPAAQPGFAAASTVAAKLAAITPPAPPSAPSPRDQRLFALGQQAEARGDLSAARRFDMIAARNNDASAALALGQLYDPTYLAGHDVIGGVIPDIAAARYWYGRARDLGQDQAIALLTALPAR